MSKQSFADKLIADAQARGVAVTVGGVNLAALNPQAAGPADSPAPAKKNRTPKLPRVEESRDVEFMLLAIQAAGFPKPEKEYKFYPGRKWAMDCAWPSVKVGFEREGGMWKQVACECGRTRSVFVSRHRSDAGYEGDLEKYNAAAAMGWIVVRGTSVTIADGRAATSLIDVLKLRSAASGNV